MGSDDSLRDVAVLVSGGIESSVLCVDLLGEFDRVFPLHVRFGLRWEDVEQTHLRAFLSAAERPGLMPLHVLDEPMADVYGGAHWSTGAPAVPGAESADEAVYLPGRNLLLAAKAAVWCHLRGIEALALGCLRSNPFADSTPAFFEGLESVVNRALGGRMRIVRPFSQLHKRDVVHRGAALGLPLHETFSCIDPRDGRHCGLCNKCAERQASFRAAALADRTPYASSNSLAPS